MCSLLQCVTVLQCVAVCLHMQLPAARRFAAGVCECCSVLQCVALCAGALQSAAVCCSILLYSALGDTRQQRATSLLVCAPL